MCEDADDDKRRAKMSRQLLRSMKDVTLEDVTAAAFDTTVYWAQQELPLYGRRFEKLKVENPDLAKQVEPYLTHLIDWDCRIAKDSTQATLCAAWYEELYGIGYPAEKLLPVYIEEPEREFKALAGAAARLTAIHGNWQVPWSDVYRIQRQPNVVELLELPFRDSEVSLPCLGGSGPMGVIFTQYYAPTVRIPFLRTLKRRYGLVGASYLAVYEFADPIRGATALNFGESGDPKSPHYFDQAVLLAERRLKRELFYWPDVVAGCKRVYLPGEEK
jgi:acyl-homoserine lactone acylase PvdQ